MNHLNFLFQPPVFSSWPFPNRGRQVRLLLVLASIAVVVSLSLFFVNLNARNILIFLSGLAAFQEY